MRNIGIIFIVLLASSCSFHSRQTKLENNKKEKAKEEMLAQQKADSAKSNIDLATLKELTPLEKVLAKKINSKTFEQDMQIIEDSKIYDKITCQSFRYSFDLLQASGQKYLDMTYKKALDRASEGSESAKRFESIGSYQTN